MTSDDVIALCTVVPLWTWCLSRIGYLRGTRGQRELWTVLALLSCAATLRLGYAERAVANWTGVDDLAVLVKHLAVMLSSILLWRWVDSVAAAAGSRRGWQRLTATRPRTITAVVAITAAIALFPFTASSLVEADGDRNFIGAQAGDLAGTAYVTAYLGTMALALTFSGALCTVAAQAARRSGQRMFSTCMYVMSSGCWIGVGYTFFRGSYLIYGLADAPYPMSAEGADQVSSLIQAGAIGLILAGVSFRGWEAATLLVQRRRRLTALRPLWQELVSVLPAEAIVRILAEAPSRLRDRYDPRGLWRRPDQRVLDISDSALEVLPWVEADLAQRARDAAHVYGLEGDDAEAAAQALCLRMGRRGSADETPRAGLPLSTPLLTLGTDLDANAAWLTRVARRYHSPLIDTLEAHIALTRKTA
ncbi:DUF6545 domain-containing protein [Streptomyces sp. NPDC058614]|uniref:DUF6545 domain-containing protein n=1 Tax=Streptomyces sp. NPDC058614 TaxID=3346557 RepID=UPI003667313B